MSRTRRRWGWRSRRLQSLAGRYAPATSGDVVRERRAEISSAGGRQMIDRWIVDSKPSTRYPIYTRANVGEVFPDPVAPLSGDFITRYSETGWRDALARFGALDH